MIVQLLAASALSYLGWSLLTLEMNYRRASSMGIPLIRLPIDPLNIFFQVFESHIWQILDFLPIPLPEFARYSRRGWHFKDKADTHLKYGPIWAHVTPRDIHVHVSDSNAIHEIFSRRADFVRPSKMYTLLEVYGPCISTADTANWPRHRKILAAPFNENAMGYVWSETIRQTSQMVDSWTSVPAAAIPSVAKDTRTLSLNILAAIGFRRSFRFQRSDEKTTDKEGDTFSYRDALQIVLDNVILLMLIPPRHLTYPWLSGSLRRIGAAASDFKKHMVHMLDEETASINRGEKGSGSLMTSFVRALHMHEKEDGGTAAKAGLSVDEIFGNIFVINFAGHDTTANTLAFSLLLLTAYPEVQEWAAEEVEELTRGKPDDEWNYTELFPLLKRCRAILLETLRLYPPIMALPKWTNDRPQTLHVNNRAIIIPPHTGVQPHIIATHTHPQYWSDPLAWNPRRWIQPNNDILVPPRDTYLPWSDGPQICPGVKFSQVESVAVYARLLAHHRLEAVRQGVETDVDVSKRVRAVVDDCDAQMLLRMVDADRVQVVCKPVRT